MEISKDGAVIVVHNPVAPAPARGGPSQITLREDLVLGRGAEAAGDPFGALVSIGVDDDGNIWVLDGRPVSLRIFDRTGRPVRTWGQKGQGPGEMEFPTDLFVRGDGLAAVYDSGARRFVLFDREGRFLRTVLMRSSRPNAGLKIDSRGRFFGISMRLREGKTQTYELLRYEDDLTPIETLAEYEEPFDREVINAIPHILRFQLTKDARLIWMTMTKYEFHILDPGGREIRRIAKDVLPLRVTAEDRSAILQEATGGQALPPSLRIEFPEYFPPVDSFLADEEGRLYVRTFEKDGGGRVWCDAFDAEGRYVARFLFPENERAAVVRKGKLYSVLEEDENGSPLLKRYALDWK